MSLANTGYGAIYYVGDAASPTGYTAVLEITGITRKNYSVSQIDTTHLLSPNTTEESMPGLLKPGTIELSGNFIGDATQALFTTKATSQTIFPFKITAGMQRNTKVLTSIGTNYVVDLETGPFEPNKKIDFKVTLQITGTVTETVA